MQYRDINLDKPSFVVPIALVYVLPLKETQGNLNLTSQGLFKLEIVAEILANEPLFIRPYQSPHLVVDLNPKDLRHSLDSVSKARKGNALSLS